MEINEFVQQIEDYAIEKGWRKKGEIRDLPVMLLNVMSEIGEAWEAVRRGKLEVYAEDELCKTGANPVCIIKDIEHYNLKPEGLAIGHRASFPLIQPSLRVLGHRKVLPPYSANTGFSLYNVVREPGPISGGFAHT